MTGSAPFVLRPNLRRHTYAAPAARTTAARITMTSSGVLMQMRQGDSRVPQRDRNCRSSFQTVSIHAARISRWIAPAGQSRIAAGRHIVCTRTDAVTDARPGALSKTRHIQGSRTPAAQNASILILSEAVRACYRSRQQRKVCAAISYPFYGTKATGGHV